MAVSLIQSLFFDFGACIPVLSGGFTLQNRGAAFALDDGPSALRPSTRPPSTLAPTIVTRAGGGLHAVLGCMGGDGRSRRSCRSFSISLTAAWMRSKGSRVPAGISIELRGTSPWS
jgi:gamma-glutamyltranspeptidase